MVLTVENSASVVAGGAGHVWVVDGPAATVTAASGAAASFTAYGRGQPAPDVQWQVSTDDGDTWSDIEGATDTTYTIDAVSDEDGYLYRAVFSNEGGSATTSASTLTVTTE